MHITSDPTYRPRPGFMALMDQLQAAFREAPAA